MKLSLICFILFALGSGSNGWEFRPDYTYDAEAESFWKFHIIPANWFDARRRCFLEGSILASPLNKAITDAMTTFMEKHGGLKCGVFTGIHATFSKGDYYSVEGIPLSEIPQKWAEDEPDNYKDEEQCIMMQKNGEMADVKCNDPLPYFCYKKDHNFTAKNACGTVDPKYTLDYRTGSCYKFHPEIRTWAIASMTCSAEGGYLAIINSDQESVVIKDLFGKYPGVSVAYIGFYTSGSKKNSTPYMTIQDAGFSKFAPNEPNGDATLICGGVFRSGLLDDIGCLGETSFICEKQPLAVATLGQGNRLYNS